MLPVIFWQGWETLREAREEAGGRDQASGAPMYANPPPVACANLN
jgi:hypothetical protein